MTPHIVNTPEEMVALGAHFASEAKPGDVFGLVGTLGAGKTHWTKGFIAAIDPHAPVTSPTFSIVNEHRGTKTPLFHFDFYRLTTATELIDLGWDEYLDENGIIICEWADLFPDLMPEKTTWLEITHLPEGGRALTRIGMPQQP